MKVSWTLVLAWLGATLVAAVTLTSGAYAIFETKVGAQATRDMIFRELQHLREDVKDIKEWLRTN